MPVTRRTVEFLTSIPGKSTAIVTIRGERYRIGDEKDGQPLAVVVVSLRSSENGHEVVKHFELNPPESDQEAFGQACDDLDTAVDLTTRLPKIERELYVDVGDWLRLGVWYLADGTKGGFAVFTTPSGKARVDFDDIAPIKTIRTAMAAAWKAER